MPSRSRECGAGSERGSVTAEFAIAVPAVVLVLAACLGAMTVAGAQVRLQDAAAAAARSVGRGDGVGVVARLAPGATAEQWTDGDLVCVAVSGSATLLAVPVAIVARSCALGAGN